MSPAGALQWRLSFPENDFEDSRSQLRDPLNGSVVSDPGRVEWVRVENGS